VNAEVAVLASTAGALLGALSGYYARRWLDARRWRLAAVVEESEIDESADESVESDEES
jgi:membrane protein DedA with SNARE-associated domain